MKAQDAYDQLLERSRERSLLESCSALLGWDEQTYMPAGGGEHRGKVSALIAGLHHERATDPKIGDLLDEVEGSDLVADPVAVEAVNVREWRRDFERASKRPRALVEELARVTSQAQQEWVLAKRQDDFPRFRPWLEQILKLKQSEAACLGASESDYDALLDDYEPGARSAELAKLFEAVRRELVPLIDAIAGAPRRPDPRLLRGDFPVDRQRIIGEWAASAVGFDFDRGRLDETEHPFCTSLGPGDCRITTRYDPNEFSDAFFSILHETGHALYDQGLDPKHHGTPMGEAVSLGIHESQSRLWENAVGRSLPFWSHAFPMVQRIFPMSLGSVALDDFHFAINQVTPSLIRVQADEVTYNLHVIIRFELERALLSGALPLDDLPRAWSEKYQGYLGIAPGNDAEGCLQDVHWAAGLFGYFPTYTIGNIVSAQLFAKAHQDLGDLETQLARGQFADLLAWLRERVHRQGKRYQATDLVRQATGGELDHRPLIEALRGKYQAFYAI